MHDALSLFFDKFVAMEDKRAILLLEDGTVFHGESIGAIGTTTGEIAFNTGMTGYQEIFTDPSYFGQILVMATSHIGNYGTAKDEIESEQVKIAGAVCKKFSRTYSRAAGDASLQEFFERDGLVGIAEVDTRALVRHIRDKGAMNAIISSEIFDLDELKAKLKAVPSMQGLELSSKVSTKTAYTVGEGGDFRVALLDLGVKKNIVRCLADRGCEVKVFPMNTSFAEMQQWEPDGYMLSNGPGDPAAMKDVIATVREIVESGTPTFGICLGHQLLALSQGLGTTKMHNGHRGINHPVKNVITGKCEVTSQNHGFEVDFDAAEQNTEVEISHVHLNDGSVAGLRWVNRPVFSVQYHPEASPGPHDSRYLFDEFIGQIKGVKTPLENA